ncbi:hypothetical protein BJV82DRAFT_620118, partial [Fennellomyces sp. T-0311]
MSTVYFPWQNREDKTRPAAIALWVTIYCRKSSVSVLSSNQSQSALNTNPIPMSISQEQTEGHRALLEIESRFNAKSHGVVIAIHGIQIHALAMFGDIFDQFPYPVIINAAILKLADWFRASNNVIKFHIYKVFKQADQHLIKVINVEESMRRILPVLNSNDPISRSLALRVLGCMSVIIADKVDVQHAILQRLEEASDRTEAEAVIWAADRFCAQSDKFSPTVFPTIEAKLKDPQLNVNIKLHLVQLFRHMHHNIAVARQAKRVCVNILENAEADQRLLLVALRTLSLLLSQALLDRKEQLDRLFNYAFDDTRKAICLSALDDLALLAKGDLSIDPSHIYRLLSLLNRETNSVALMERRYTCAQTLLKSYRQLVLYMMRETWRTESRDSFVLAMNICEERLLRAVEAKQFSLAISCARFLTIIFELALEHEDTKSLKFIRSLDKVSLEAVSDLQTIAIRLSKRIEEADITKLLDKSGKLSLQQARHIVKLQARLLLLLRGASCTESFRQNFEKMIASEDDVIISLLAPFLLAISINCYDMATWFPEMALQALESCPHRTKLYVSIIQLLLRTTGMRPKVKQELSTRILDELDRFGSWNEGRQTYTNNGWYMYIIASEAGCNGWHAIMQRILWNLSRMVQSEASKYWLSAVSLLGQAETSFNDEQQTQIYLDSLMDLQAFQSLVGSRRFQSWYIQLRMEMVSVTRRMNKLLSLIEADGEPTKQLSKNLQQCGMRFRELASRYDFIAQSFLGMDDATLLDLEVYKVCALVCEYAVRTFIRLSGSFFCVDPALIPLLNIANDRMVVDSDAAPTLQEICLTFMQTVITWEEEDRQNNSSYYHLCAQDIRQFTSRMLEQPLSIPRYFFDRQRSVNVQLTVDPALSDKHPIMLQEGQDLAINFEGFVNLSGKEAVKIEKAAIVCSVTEERTKHFSDKLGNQKNLADPHQSAEVMFLAIADIWLLLTDASSRPHCCCHPLHTMHALSIHILHAMAYFTFQNIFSKHHRLDPSPHLIVRPG